MGTDSVTRIGASRMCLQTEVLSRRCSFRVSTEKADTTAARRLSRVSIGLVSARTWPLSHCRRGNAPDKSRRNQWRLALLKPTDVFLQQIAYFVVAYLAEVEVP